jgi:hypothetical protein
LREKVRESDLEPVPGFAEPTVNDAGILFGVPGRACSHEADQFSPRDKTHIIDMDSVGLITPEIEAGLSEPLRERLEGVRAEERRT